MISAAISLRQFLFRIRGMSALALIAGLAITAVAADAPSDPAASKGNPARAATKPGQKPPAAAKPAGKQPASGLSDDLLNDGAASDLDNQLLEGAGPTRPSTGKTPAPPPAIKPARPVLPEMTPPAPADNPAPADDVEAAENANPLIRVGEQMRAVERRLEALRGSDADTRELQEQIVAELSELIKQLERQQSSQQSSSSSKRQPPSPSSERKSVRQPGTSAGSGQSTDRRPAKESNERSGKGERVPPTADELRGLMKERLADLPAREREQMLQSPPEQFLPKYELLLEKYYKRLAEEQNHRP